MSSSHWTEQNEVGGGYWQFRLLLKFFSLLGPAFVGVLTRPIVFFLFLGAGKRRTYSREFLNRARDYADIENHKKVSVLRHFQSFASVLVDKMAAWAGILELKDLTIDESGDFNDLVETLRSGQGVVALCSHLGNMEVLRAFGSRSVEEGQDIPDFRILALVEFEGTAQYNQMLKSIDGNSMQGIIPVSEIGPDTIIRLKDFIESGGMVVIAADRTSTQDGGRQLSLDFLGKQAAFPYGSFLLADLLEAPVYTVFALRENETALSARYCYHVSKAPVSMGGSRKGRGDRIVELAGFFRSILERLAVEYPYQWFNFYKYWN